MSRTLASIYGRSDTGTLDVETHFDLCAVTEYSGGTRTVVGSSIPQEDKYYEGEPSEGHCRF